MTPAPTALSGTIGVVLARSMSWHACINGFAAAWLLGTAWLFLGAYPTSFIASLLGLVIGLGLARIALAGQRGQLHGSIFATCGVGWRETLDVGLRFWTLSLLWALPLVAAIAAPSEVAGRLPLVVAIGVFGWLSTPLLLVVSTSADRFSDIFSGALWHELFLERPGARGDVALMTLLALASGAIALAPLAAALAGWGALASTLDPSRDPIILLSAGLLLIPLGWPLTLLARLAGFIAFGDRPLVVDSPAPTSERVLVLAGARPASHDAVALCPQASPPLLDVRETIQRLWRQFESDHDAAISTLEDVCESHATSAQALHALCLMQHRAGREEAAARTARFALPLCLQRGHSVLAAELFSAVLPQVGTLGLSDETLITLGETLSRMHDDRSAANAFAIAIHHDPTAQRAVSGMLALAERQLARAGQADEALRLYRFLSERCVGSPLAPLIASGRSEAERRVLPG